MTAAHLPRTADDDARGARATMELMIDSDLPRIGAPATRALATIGVTRLEQLDGRSRAELLALHGFGPRALRVLDAALAARGISMRP